MKYEVTQTNTYQYDLPVRQSINQFRLKPLHDQQQTLHAYNVLINPASQTYGHTDYWGNYVETFYLWGEHQDLSIETVSTVETKPFEIDLSLPLTDEQRKELHSDAFKQAHTEFMIETDYTTISDGVMESETEGLWKEARDELDFAVKLNEHIYNTMEYVSGATDVETTAEKILTHRTGVCQDYTHLMLALCRYRGIPARYVSGYIYIGENSAYRGDAATHAWLEVKIPGLPWIGLDPTNNAIAAEQHIRIAVGRDYRDISPLKGVYIGGAHTLSVSVGVKNLEERVS
ncbi:transglutaminase family protein [Guptibacillus hwajinpoensis]|uniref:Transglutaminase-like putative cysteine protease n=1 Tax=Guptibacillus hwajinpoensis TaxID=208199 RepID=A0ABU0K040_9BACL|nr:transglutaminase family protein [Alkalihalobacillus hemicentroti]MDQ0482654.1 transglutaminase-like putative cysteine protease [Alkalihalobacillus hemicentroti]